MALTNFDEDQFDQERMDEEGTPEPEKKPGNRAFLTAMGILGAILVIALVLLLLVAPGLLAKQRAAQQEQAARINAANTATALAATSIAQQATLAVKTTVPPTAVTRPTKTPVIIIVVTTPGAGTQLSPAEMATVNALQTQMAGGAGTGTPRPTSTALPTTGFADEVGLPLMAGLAVVLVAVIILSRRLRLSSR
jgi:hypothetical protein